MLWHENHNYCFRSNLQVKEVVILSQQMGLAVFYVARDFSGQVKIFDFKGLVEDSFLECSISQNYGKDARGLSLHVKEYFEEITLFEELCEIPRPDIIFGIHTDLFVNGLEKNGYTIFFEQTGSIMNSVGFTGRILDGSQFIAVDNNMYSNFQNIRLI